MQGFITESPWEAGDVFAEIQAVFAEELVPTAAQWSIGTVGVIDESGFVKAGSGKRGGGPAMVRPAGEGRQLPGGRVFDGRHAGRHGAVGRAIVSHRGVDRRPQAPQEDSRSAGGEVPDASRRSPRR